MGCQDAFNSTNEKGKKKVKEIWGDRWKKIWQRMEWQRKNQKERIWRTKTKPYCFSEFDHLHIYSLDDKIQLYRKHLSFPFTIFTFSLWHTYESLILVLLLLFFFPPQLWRLLANRLLLVMKLMRCTYPEPFRHDSTFDTILYRWPLSFCEIHGAPQAFP